jgi:hypothetical protein
MNERYNEQLDLKGNQPEYDLEELVGDLKKMVSSYNGEYSESLKVDSDGRIQVNSRNRDKAPAFLPGLIMTRDGRGPSIDEMYGVLKDVADHLPEYEVSISEDRTAESFEYRIREKEA